jgi:hypothetical protein
LDFIFSKGHNPIRREGALKLMFPVKKGDSKWQIVEK